MLLLLTFQKAGDVKEFAEKEVVPELKKVYEAAKAAAESESEGGSVEIPEK